MTAHIVIPFRDRGRDPLRAKNLACVLDWWTGSEWPVHVVVDGRSGDEQFNRSAAYNRGLRLAAEAGADAVIYTESDMLVPWGQVADAVYLSLCQPGLVVPFQSYRYLSEHDAERVRGGAGPGLMVPESVMDGGAAIGAVNVVSLDTMQAVGQWDETFEGSWYDDTAMFHAFRVAAGEPRWIDGPGWHLYHLPGWTGDHLTDEDKAATKRNAARCAAYYEATTPERIRELTAGGA